MKEFTSHWIRLSSPSSGAVADDVFAYGALALLVLFGLAFLFRPRRRRRPCRWQRTKGRSGGSLAAYRCRVCGVEAFSTTGQPPADCKRDLHAPPL